jgi:hypothetical protein
VPLYATKSGEQVLVPEDHPEARRLAASEHWDEVPEKKPRARAPRPRGTAATSVDTGTTDGEQGTTEDPPPGDD